MSEGYRNATAKVEGVLFKVFVFGLCIGVICGGLILWAFLR
jgi:hypothetical protein